MNQKTAKKIRRILREAVAQRDAEGVEVAGPGDVRVTKEPTKQVAYSETEKNRKPFTKVMPADTEVGQFDYEHNGVKHKVIGVARGTMLVQPSTVRGVYLALKDGFKKQEALQRQGR
jgi:hypothetical protein